MLRHKRESALTVQLHTKLLLGIVLLTIVLSLSGQQDERFCYFGKVPESKLPFFRLILLTEKSVFQLGEDIEIYVLLKNEGWGGYVSSFFYCAGFKSPRVPKNNLTIEVWDSQGNKIPPKEVPVIYGNPAQADLDYFEPLGFKGVCGYGINLSRHSYFIHPINKPGIYTIQATFETECRKYVEEMIKKGTIKESDLGVGRSLDHFINGTFKSNTIQIEIKK